MPQHYTAPENRTYSVQTKGRYAGYVEKQEKKLFGWTQTDDNPQVKAVISLYGYQIGRSKKDSAKKTKKNKDGEVTDRWTEYTYSNSATGLASLHVYGPNNSFKDSKKKKEEPEEKAEEKKVNDNPFLTQEIVDEAEESDVGEDEGLADAALPFLGKYNVNRTKSIETKAYRKSSDAYKAYQNLYEDLKSLQV